MSVNPLWFLYGLGLPAMLAALIAMIGLKPRGGRPAAPPRVAATWVLAVAAGTALALPLLHGMPADDAWARPLTLFEWHRWLWFATLPLAVAGVLFARAGPPRAVGAALGATTAATVLVFECLPLIRHAWDAQRAATWIVSLSAGTLALAAAGHLLSTRAGRELPPILGLIAVGAGMTVAFSGSESIGLTLVALGAVLAGGGAVALFADCRAAYGAAAPALLVLAWGLAAGYLYTYDTYSGEPGLRPVHALVLAASPLLGFVADVPLPRTLDRPRVRAGLRAAVMLAPVAAVAVRAGLAFAAEMQQTGAYY